MCSSGHEANLVIIGSTDCQNDERGATDNDRIGIIAR